MKNTLESTIAGSWYPGTAERLRARIDRYLGQVPDPPAGTRPPNILVLPHAGYDYSGPTAAHGIRRLQGAPFTRVVLLAPSHRALLDNRMAVPEAEAVATPLGTIPVDHAVIDRLARGAPVVRSDAVHAGEHSAQIQYPFLQVALNAFTLVPCVVGSLDDVSVRRMADALLAAMDAETLLVVSSDFTHYGLDFGFAPFRGDVRAQVERLDYGAVRHMQERDAAGFVEYVDRTGATICGRNPIAVMLAMLPPGARLEPLHYETSSDQTRDFSRFVCYLSMAGYADWQPPSPDAAGDDLAPDEKQKLLAFARRSIQHVLKTGSPLPDDAFADEATGGMRRRMGCFVTLKIRDTQALRGCIGEIAPRRPLFRAVTALAVQSAFRDPRFEPLTEREFGSVAIEISALTPERPVASWRDIEIGRHGMTLCKRGRAAVFLPQVAPEQGWSLEETLSHLALKAGLAPDAWREGAMFTVFEAIVFGEEDPGGRG
ncbi:MAG: AmmeMemoRadiSam system protein B [Kiritimatiellia bacterium]|jgi:AmmeMemoRadiSam system protein B/AmmeMemoRadiSam system protein A